MRITLIVDGKETEISLKEFHALSKTQTYVAMPRELFENYYKRMKLPKAVREYHMQAKHRAL